MDSDVEIVREDYDKLLPSLRETKWEVLTEKYKLFLEKIPLSDYRRDLQSIKTIEFDLSGRYRSFHLSLIYHLYWKRKFVILVGEEEVPLRCKVLRNVVNWIIDRGGKIPLYQMLGQFDFNTEGRFTEWLYLKEYSKGIRPTNFIGIKHKLLSADYEFPSFEDFWRKYKNNIDLNDFIDQHRKFVDIEVIKSQITREIEEQSDIFRLLKKEDVRTEKADELIKGYILVGLKARMYRTWVSLLTQLDLSYTWNRTVEKFKVDSDVMLDVKGIDIFGEINNSFIGIQIKKRSRRHEALKVVESKTPIKTINIPYDLNFEDDKYLRKKLKRLKNGFVVFTENYINHIVSELCK